MSLAARRATTRIAWRQAKLAKWRSLLIVAMIGLPITALVAAGIIAVTITPSPEERALGERGNADFTIHTWDKSSLTADDVVALLPPGSEAVVRRSWYVDTVVGGTLRSALIADAAIDDPLLGPMYRLVSGRAAEALDEIAVSPRVLEQFSVSIGDRISLGPEARTFRIVGEVIAPERLRESLGLVAPGALDDLDGLDDFRGEMGWAVTEIFVNVPGVTGWHAIAMLPQDDRIGGFGGETDESGLELAITGIALGVAALVLIETGLVAAAAFVVGAHRRLRTVGLIGAAGGEPRHVRHVLLTTGAVLGLVGSLTGIAAGIGIAWLVSPHLDRLAGRITGGTEYPLVLLIGALLLGTIAATLAALAPARAASRIATVDALDGRTPAPRPPGRLARRGLVAVALGSVATVWGTATGHDPVLTSGLVAVLIGFLVTIPLLVAGVGRMATRLPLSLRIAARDTARHGRRTSGAVAAAVVALAVPVMVATITLSNDARHYAEPMLADDQLLVDVPDPTSIEDSEPFLEELESEVFPEATLATFAVAFFGEGPDPGPGGYGDEWYPASVTGPLRQGDDGSAGATGAMLHVGDADLLGALHAEAYADDLVAGRAVVFDAEVIDGEIVHLEERPSEAGTWPDRMDLPAVNADAGLFRPGYLPGVVISPERAAELGLHRASWEEILLRAAGPITHDQLERARAVAARYPGAHVTALADTIHGDNALRNGALALAAASALAIVGVAVALVSAESRRDHAILTAVGAGPGTRRKVVGGSALLLAGLAGVVAVPTGFIPVTLIQSATNEGYPIIVPWFAVAVVIVGVPVVAGLIAAAVSRRPPAARLLRPIA